MEIREATNADVASIAKLYTENWKETYKNLLPDEFLDHLNFEDSKQKWGSYLLEKGHKIFVAYEEDVFLGFSACKEDDEIQNCLYLDSLHVSKVARGKGVGTELIRKVGNYAAHNGDTRMSICIVKGNDTAKRLYEKMGARHYKDFTDHFGETESNSEKLIWDNLQPFYLK